MLGAPEVARCVGAVPSLRVEAFFGDESFFEVAPRGAAGGGGTGRCCAGGREPCTRPSRDALAEGGLVVPRAVSPFAPVL